MTPRSATETGRESDRTGAPRAYVTSNPLAKVCWNVLRNRQNIMSLELHTYIDGTPQRRLPRRLTAGVHGDCPY